MPGSQWQPGFPAGADEGIGEMNPIRQATDYDRAILSQIIRCSFKEVADRYGLTSENCPTHPSNCAESRISRDLQKGKVYLILEQEYEAVG